jgi:signal transduction histidine kinase
MDKVFPLHPTTRDALATFARYVVTLFWIRQVMFIGATIGASLLLQSIVPAFLCLLCILFEVIELWNARQALAARDLTQAEIDRHAHRAEWIAVFSSLAIIVYAATVAEMEPTTFHFMSFFYMFAAALYVAMFSHMLTRLLVIRIAFFTIGFVAIATWEILDGWPLVEGAAYVQLLAVSLGGVFLIMNAREFAMSYAERTVRNAELLERQRRFEDYAQTASDLFFETDSTLSVDLVSSVSEWPGYEVFDGEGPPSLQLSRILREEAQAIRTHWTNQTAFRNVEIKTGGNGHPRKHLLLSGVPKIGEKGTFEGYRGTVRDVTEFVESRELAQDLQEQLNHSERLRSLGELSGGVAHDFNNILSVIQGNLELLLGTERLSEDTQHLVSEAIAATVRGGALTHDLLALGRKARLQPEPVDLMAITDFVAGLLRRSFPSSIRLSVAAPHEMANTIVLADRALLEHAILNLAINARDALHGNGDIRFSVRNDPPDWVCLDIRDTGIGMDAVTLRRATEPYFSTKSFQRGSGIGLSVVQGFMGQSDGELKLHSMPGHGTCATLCFHAFKETLHAPLSPSLSPSEPTTLKSSGQESVLLVEDEPAVRMITERILQYLGYSVRSAPDAEKALSLLESGPLPRVVISDVDMPGEHDGLALALILKDKYPELPVLLVSGYPLDQESQSDCPLRRALQKPVGAAELAEAIQSLLERNPQTVNDA